jgi:hypothetical protein
VEFFPDEWVSMRDAKRGLPFRVVLLKQECANLRLLYHQIIMYSGSFGNKMELFHRIKDCRFSHSLIHLKNEKNTA